MIADAAVAVALLALWMTISYVFPSSSAEMALQRYADRQGFKIDAVRPAPWLGLITPHIPKPYGGPSFFVVRAHRDGEAARRLTIAFDLSFNGDVKVLRDDAIST